MLIQHIPYPKLNKAFIDCIVDEIGGNEYFKKWDQWCDLHGIAHTITEKDLADFIMKAEDKEKVSELLTPVFDLIGHKETHNNTKPRAFTILISISYMYMLGFRWKQYTTMDGVVMGLERAKPVSKFPMILRNSCLFLEDFHRLSGKNFAHVVRDGAYREIGISESAFYISF